MPQFAEAACLVFTFGAALLLQGCGGSSPPPATTPAPTPVPLPPAPTPAPTPAPLPLPFTLQCGREPDEEDPDCTVLFFCGDDGDVYRTSSLDCKVPNHTSHSTYGETCADWEVEDPVVRRCGIATACCAYSNTGMDPTSDSVCGEAMACMNGPHPEPTPVPLPFTLQCGEEADDDPDCTVQFFCGEDGEVYRTSGLDCKVPNQTSHSTYGETCADWEVEDPVVRRCGIAGACCAYSNTGMDPTSDSVCGEAMACMTENHTLMVAV